MLSVIEKQVGDHHGAHDLAQEAWMRVFGALRAFRSDAAFRPWLFAIVLNLVRDDQRRRVRHAIRFHRAEPEPSTDAVAPRRDDPSRCAAERDALETALASVPEPFRAALQLVDALGFNYDEAAASLACSIGTVRSRVHRGRLAFRDSYQRLVGAADHRSARPAPATRSEVVHGAALSNEELK